MKVKLYFALAMLLCTVRAYCQASPYSLTIYAPQVFVASGVTGTPIQLNGLTTSTSTVGSSYSVGSITVAGTSLTTATFSVMGSSDNGATYHLLPIYTVASPLGAPTTSVTVTSGGLYQINLATLTHVEFVTSGTFTATNLTLTFTASPNGNLSRNGGGSSGSGIGSITWGLPSFMTASPATLSASGSENFTFGTLPVGNGGTGGTGGTGYAYGNGTGPYSYVSTIPVSALSSSTITINNVPCALAGNCDTPLICAGTGGTCGIQQINPVCANPGGNATTTAAITAGSTSIPVSSTACFSPSGIAFYGGIADAGGFFTWTSISGNTLEGVSFYANGSPIYAGAQPSENAGVPLVQVVAASSGTVNSYPYFAQYQNGGVTYGPPGNGNASTILNGNALFGGSATVNGSVTASAVVGAAQPTTGVYGAELQAVDYNYRGGHCGIPDLQYPTNAGGYIWDVVAANEYCTASANGLAAGFFGIRASTNGTGVPGFTIDPNYNVSALGASTADHFAAGSVNPSTFPAGITVSGQLPCLQNGTDCPSSTSGVSQITGPSAVATGNITLTGPAVSQNGGTFTINTSTGSFFALTPTANQTVNQGNYTSTFAATPTAFPGSGSYNQWSYNLNCYMPGWDVGPSGTSAQGWSYCSPHTETFMAGSRGIMQRVGSNFSHFGIGDTADEYGYLTAFGGKVSYADEGVTGMTKQVHQMGDFYGPINSGASLGSNLITTSAMNCSGYCMTLDTRQFPDGGIMLDLTQPGTTATLGSQGTASVVGSGSVSTYYNLTSGTVTPSTAWGQIISSSCTGNGNGQGQTYTSTTCNVTLGTSPASPGNFVAGQDIYLTGPFEEEAAVTAVGVASGGVQSITFNTRYAWNAYNSVVMQGGPGGQSFTTGANQPAYFVLGATSSTQVFFANCVVGVCNGGAGVIPAAGTSVTFYPSAFITGDNGGISSNANLATNHVNWTNGDTVEGAPSSEFSGDVLRLVYGQTTPIDGGQASAVVSLQDDGPTNASSIFSINQNQGQGNGNGGSIMTASGSYGNDFYFGYRPANGGAMLYTQGTEPNGEASTPYYIWKDDSSYGQLKFDPNAGVLSSGTNLEVPGTLMLAWQETPSYGGMNLIGHFGQPTGSCGSQAAFQFDITDFGQPANLSYCDGVNSWLPVLQMNTANTSVNIPAASTAGNSTICTAANAASTPGCGGGSYVADVTVTAAAGTYPGYGVSGYCSTVATVTAPNAAMGMGVWPTDSGDPVGVTGWNPGGGMSTRAWVSAANTISYIFCNTGPNSVTTQAYNVILVTK